MLASDNPDAASSETDHRSSHVVANDGTVLHVEDRGHGPVLVLIPGWSQTAAEFGKQIDHFSQTRRVVAIDHRGHGQSATPAFGYRVSRLAADLHDVLATKHLDRVDLLAHSMGCAVVWAYWDAYGGSRVRSVVLVDQPATMTASPLYGEADAEEIGAPLDAEAVAGFAAALTGPDGELVTRQTLTSMFSSSVADRDLAWVLEQNHKTPRDVAARLFLDEALNDWRDVIPRISVPSLVIGGAASLYPPAGAYWLAEHIPDSRVHVFNEAERGSHFMFWENPELFNQLVDEFLDGIKALDGLAEEPRTPRAPTTTRRDDHHVGLVHPAGPVL